jgi:drug/metabolite transporter (DMT)-like permease
VRLELLPIIFGAIIALGGIALVADAWLPDSNPRVEERRRRQRAERHRAGEAVIGLGVVALGAAIMGRDAWRGSMYAVIIGGVLLIVGALMNRRFLREQMDFRGPARRDPNTQHKPGMPDPPPREKFRVR